MLSTWVSTERDEERLVSFVSGELDSQVTACGLRVHRVRMGFSLEALLDQLLSEQIEIRGDDDQIRVKCIHGIDVAVDRQPADQAIRPERFTGRDHSREVGRAAVGNQFVSLRSRHNSTLT